jgi:5'-deoxynucleotidase YfbR-like HD superfamily hydrolase
MLSGRRLDLLDPSPMDIEIEDIAHGLARVARWNGQTLGEHGFSVAQLLHDAPEYVIGDMISPFKAALGFNYRAFEDRLEAAIHIRFGLPPKVPAAIKALIKQADRACAFFEATQLAGFSEAESLKLFGRPPAGYHLDIHPQPASLAQAHYVERFHTLSEAAGYERTAAAFDTE